MRQKIVWALCGAMLLGCGAMERAAARDPRRCEHDPNCHKKRDRTHDCSTQCADDPACVERCSQVQQSTGMSSR